MLSLGHSQSTQAQAEEAFHLGFQGVTHAWNALGFHHRAPGVLGAALGRKGVHVELMIDGVHIDDTLVDWTLKLHRPQPICFISDCLSAGGKPPGSIEKFGSLQVHNKDGACRLLGGALAGGGMVLSEAYSRWIEKKAKNLKSSPGELKRLLTSTIQHVTTDPLRPWGSERACFRTIKSLGFNQNFLRFK